MSTVSVTARIEYNYSDLHRRASSFDYERRVQERVKTDPRIAAIMEQIADEEMDRINRECRSRYEVVTPKMSVGVTLDDIFETAMTGRPIARVEIGNITVKRTSARVQF